MINNKITKWEIPADSSKIIQKQQLLSKHFKTNNNIQKQTHTIYDKLTENMYVNLLQVMTLR